MERNFLIWIPAYLLRTRYREREGEMVLTDKNEPDSKKIPHVYFLILAEINGLLKEKGYCYANDDHFAELFDISNRQVQNALKFWEGVGVIKRVIMNELDGKKGTWRRIHISQQLFSNCRSTSSSSTGSEPQFREGLKQGSEGVRTTVHGGSEPQFIPKESTQEGTKESTQQYGCGGNNDKHFLDQEDTKCSVTTPALTEGYGNTISPHSNKAPSMAERSVETTAPPAGSDRSAILLKQAEKVLNDFEERYIIHPKRFFGENIWTEEQYDTFQPISKNEQYEDKLETYWYLWYEFEEADKFLQLQLKDYEIRKGNKRRRLSEEELNSRILTAYEQLPSYQATDWLSPAISRAS